MFSLNRKAQLTITDSDSIPSNLCQNQAKNCPFLTKPDHNLTQLPLVIIICVLFPTSYISVEPWHQYSVAQSPEYHNPYLQLYLLSIIRSLFKMNYLNKSTNVFFEGAPPSGKQLKNNLEKTVYSVVTFSNPL